MLNWSLFLFQMFVDIYLTRYSKSSFYFKVLKWSKTIKLGKIFDIPFKFLFIYCLT